MTPNPKYLSILDVAFGWHGIPTPSKFRGTLPPVVRITLAMLLRAVVDARLAVYGPLNRGTPSGRQPSNAKVLMEEIEGTPTALAEMHASGRYDQTVLCTYRLCMDDLFVWATGEDLDPPALCIPSWACFDRSAARNQSRNPRPQITKRSAESPRTQAV